jgi:hypothetical protein
MKSHLALRLRFLPVLSMLNLAVLVLIARPMAVAEPIPVRHVNGTIHGFLELRSEDGRVLASGDVVRVAHGDQITSHVVFHFKDGSVDEDTTVFSQHRSFHLITDHHVQKGPSFPHPLEMTIDTRSGVVTVHTAGKDGKDETNTSHMTLPDDLANGMLSFAIENLAAKATEDQVSMVVATPKPRLVKLVITSSGEESFSIGGEARKANHYTVKIMLGGVAGVVAPLIGKEPQDLQIWTVGGEAPAMLREQGQLFADGPTWTIELASPAWGDASRTEK